MALNGTLEDLGIVEVFQLPQRGRHTGHLILNGESGRASLFYEKGALVHAEYNGVRGVDVLVELLDLEQGDFEFRRGEETSEHTISIDLHQAMMQALKIRDEKKREAELAREKDSQDAPTPSQLLSHLREFIDTNAYAIYGCVLDGEGQVLGEASKNADPPEKAREIQQVLFELCRSYPSTEPFRLVIEEREEKVVLSRLSHDQALVVIAAGNVPMGAVMIAVGRLGHAIIEG